MGGRPGALPKLLQGTLPRVLGVATVLLLLGVSPVASASIDHAPGRASGNALPSVLAPASPRTPQARLPSAPPDERAPSVTPCRAPCVVAEDSIGPMLSNPVGVAFDSALDLVFVAESNASDVVGVDPSNGTIVAQVNVGSGPEGIVYDPNLGELVVANSNSSNVSVISDSSDSVLANVPVGSEPEGLACDPAASKVFVANDNSSNVSVISLTNDRVVANVPVGSQPVAVAFDPGRDLVYVANYNSSNVSVISATSDQVVATVPVGAGPTSLVYDPGRNQVFVGANLSGDVDVISDSTNSIVGQVPGMTGVSALTYVSASGIVYAASLALDTLVGISDTTDSLVSSTSLGIYPAGLAYDPVTGEVLVSIWGFGSLEVVWDGTHPYVWYVEADPQWSRLGTPVTLQIVAAGGEGVLHYAYAGLPAGCTSTDASNLTCVPARPGSFEPRGYANDSAGSSSSSTTSLTVDPMEVRGFTATPSDVLAGSPVLFNFTVLGGVGALTYRYSGLPPGCASSNHSLLSCTPSTEGNYTVQGQATDQDGNSNTSVVALQVFPTTAPQKPTNSTPGFLGLPGNDGYFLLIDAALAVLLLVVLLLFRRRSRRSTGTSSSAPSRASAPRSDDDDEPAGEAAEGSPEPGPEAGTTIEGEGAGHSAVESEDSGGSPGPATGPDP